MTRQAIVLLLCAVLAGGCATSGGRLTMAPSPQAAAPYSQGDQAVLAEYVLRLPPGTRVRVDRLGGEVVKGTLMKASDAAIVVQRRTRVPEPPLEIPLNTVLAVTPETTNGVAKAIGVGAAAGAAAALGTLLILAAVFSD